MQKKYLDTGLVFCLFLFLFVFGCLENPAGQAAKAVPSDEPNAPVSPSQKDFVVSSIELIGQNANTGFFNVSIQNIGSQTIPITSGLVHRCRIINP